MKSYPCSLLIAVASLLATAIPAWAQPYPSRAVRIVVHAPPGSAPDILSRALGQQLTDVLGQPIVVENRTGSNGNIAGELVAKSAPDGHTLALCVDSQIAINPHVYSKMSYDPLKDLVPIATIATNEFVLTVHPSLPVKDFRDFIAFARKANPPLTYGSGGNGSQHHLTMEMLQSRAGIKLVHVPYKGAAPALVDLISGHVQVQFNNVVGSLPHVRAGKLRALGVSTATPSSVLPDVPPVARTYPGFDIASWMGIYAPAGTPKPIIDQITRDVAWALNVPEAKRRLTELGAEVVAGGPDELTAYARGESALFGKLVSAAGIPKE